MAATSSIPDRSGHAPPGFGEPRSGLSADRPVRGLRPATAVRPRRTLPWLRMSLMSAAVVAVLAFFAQHREPEPEGLSGPVPQATLVAPPSAWQAIARPVALFAVSSAEGKVLQAQVEARRHTAGGREDSLVFGAFGEEGHGRLSLARGQTERPSERFYVDLVRRAAAAGLSVVRSGQSEPVLTKFGPVEVASATLSDGAEQACLAFRFAHPELSFGFQGWLCGARASSVGRDQLACLIDRVALTNAAEDTPLKVLFAQVERRRLEACAPPARVAMRPSRS